MKIVILGLGPCGLGAAYRLHQLGHQNWVAYERGDKAGGLSSSFTDDKGFVWDIGGHVLYSKYEYYNTMIEENFSEELNSVKRNAYSWGHNKFIPYPFHLNIKHLPKKQLWECIDGLLDTMKNDNENILLNNFEEWLIQKYGKGIYDQFMGPYNKKVWAYEPSEMGYYWIKDRIAEVQIKDIIKDVVLDNEKEDWGPNSYFKYPKRGGTGYVWEEISKKLPESKINFNKEVVKINIDKKRIFFEDGSYDDYDILFSTLPLNKFVRLASLNDFLSYVERLKYSSVHAIGLGIKGNTPEKIKTTSWMYFPTDEIPCYRITVLSNYSKNNTPDESHYSLLCEVSEPMNKCKDKNQVIDELINGALNIGLIQNESDIVSKWYYKAEYGYPTPTVDRNDILRRVQPFLMKRDIYSRGRFGAWCYEISNQDHTFMQGVEFANKVLLGEEEKTWKLY